MKLPTRKRAVLVAVVLSGVFGVRTLSPASAAPPEPVDAASVTPEVPASRLLHELRRRNDELDARERGLVRRERSLEEFASEAKSTLAELDARRAQLEERIEALGDLQGDGVARLAKVYAAMPPARAAELLAQLDVEVASIVLARMKPKISAGVLAAMGSDQALRLTEHAALPFDGTVPAGGAEGRFR